MGKLKEVIEEYRELFRELGLDFNIRKALFLESIQEESLPVKMSIMTKKIKIHRTEVYAIVSELEKYGLVVVYEQGELTPEEEREIEERFARRDRTRARREVIRAKRVKFTPKGIIPHIDKRIKELEDFKQKIEAGEIF